LVRSLADIHKVSPEAIEVGSGSSELIQSFLTNAVAAGDSVVIWDPTYGEYVRCIKAVGGRAVRVPLSRDDGFKPHTSAVLDAADNRAKVIVICNPNNPTGKLLPKSDLVSLIHSLSADTLVLVDETYIDYTPDHSVISLISDMPNLAIVRSLSKAYGLAGLRVGYLIAGTEARAKVRKHLRLPWPLGLLAVKAAEAALRDELFVTRRVQQTLRLKASLTKGLAQCPGLKVLPSDTHYFLIDIRGTGFSSPTLCDGLCGMGIYVRNCESFGPQMEKAFIRVTTQSAKHNQLIIRGFAEALSASSQAGLNKAEVR